MTRICTDQEAYEFIEEFLRTRERLPWKTARYLSDRLRKKQGCRLGAGEVEALLHSRMEEGRVRYSQFPGRQSLDLLWGHRDRVGELEQLWNPRLDAEELRREVGEFTDCEISPDAPWVFLSHSFQNIDTVRIVRRKLIDRGYGVWMAETHVLGGESIVHKVQEGLEQADRFAMFATRKSLASRWVLKEGGLAARRWRLPAVLIVDAGDPDLVAAVRAWVTSEWKPEMLCRVADLATDDPIDPIAPTSIEELLVSALGETDTASRYVVLFSEDPQGLPAPEDPHWWKSLDEAFPLATGN